MSDQNRPEFAIEFPDLPDNTPARDPSKPSIRQIILTGLKQGKNTPSIAAVIRQYWPDSAAAAKSSKHIAYYRSLVKQGRA
jgi:hypothetical protein